MKDNEHETGHGLHSNLVSVKNKGQIFNEYLNQNNEHLSKENFSSKNVFLRNSRLSNKAEIILNKTSPEVCGNKRSLWTIIFPNITRINTFGYSSKEQFQFSLLIFSDCFTQLSHMSDQERFVQQISPSQCLKLTLLVNQNKHYI